MIVGDSNMSETTTMLKVASCDLVLRMIEEGVVMRDLTMENPIRAIREISHDVTGQRKVRLANGREASALDIQGEYLSKARDFVDRREISTPIIERALDLWERGLKAVESDDLGLVDREIDWVIKWKLIDRYRAKHGLPLGHPRIAQLDLAYHDIHRGRGLYYLLEKRGAVARVTTDLKIFQAKSVPPQTTRARLRGEFIRKAQERRRDFTVDWVQHQPATRRHHAACLFQRPHTCHMSRGKLPYGMPQQHVGREAPVTPTDGRAPPPPQTVPAAYRPSRSTWRPPLSPPRRTARREAAYPAARRTGRRRLRTWRGKLHMIKPAPGPCRAAERPAP